MLFFTQFFITITKQKKSVKQIVDLYYLYTIIYCTQWKINNIEINSKHLAHDCLMKRR